MGMGQMPDSRSTTFRSVIAKFDDQKSTSTEWKTPRMSIREFKGRNSAKYASSKCTAAVINFAKSIHYSLLQMTNSFISQL